MDFTYLQQQQQDRQDSRPAPENGRGHPQNQYPVHCEHQQYPTGHQVMSTGYPSLGFGSYIHPIQALISSPSPGMASQESLHPPRMMVQDSTGSSSSSNNSPGGMPFRTESQQSTHLQHVLHSVAHQPHLMQPDAAFHVDRSGIVQNDPGHPSRTSSGHSSHTVSSGIHHGRRQHPIDPRPPNPRHLNPETNFHMSHPVVTQPVVTQPIVTQNVPSQTSALSSSHDAVGASSQISSTIHQEKENRGLVERPLLQSAERASVLKTLGQMPESQAIVSRPPAVSSVSSVSSVSRPLEVSSSSTPVEVLSASKRMEVSSASRPVEAPSASRPVEVLSASRCVETLSSSAASRPLRTTSETNTKYCQTEPLFEMLPFPARTLSSSFNLMEGFSYKMTGEDTSPGVVVTKDLQAGEEFGPFTGEFVSDDRGIIDPTSWEICVRGKTGLYMSGTCDPNNWMTHVQVARSRDEQNMEAFQFYGDIFFRTTKAVEAGTELRVFYSKDYCKKVGFRMGLEDLKIDRGSGKLKCRDCGNRYLNSKSLLRHIKFEHDKENFPVTPWTREEESAPPQSRPVLRVKQEQTCIAEMESTSVSNFSKEESRKRAKSRELSKHLQVKFLPPKMKQSSVKMEKMETISPFMCGICQKQFPSKGHLEAHSAFHEEVKASTRSCNTCGLLCKSVKELKQHEISHIPDAFQCHMCKRYFRMRKHMVQHLRHDHHVFKGKKWSQADVDDLLRDLRVSRNQQEEQPKDDEKKLKSPVTKKKKQKCVDCKQVFEDKDALEQHECEQKIFKCQYCDKIFQKNSHRVAHLREEHKIYIWKQYSLKMEERLSRLIRPEDQVEDSSFHPDLPRDMLGKQIARALTRPKMYKCKFCPKKFTAFYACSKHEKQMHTYSGNFMCEFCSAVFVAETEYIMHKTKHTRDRLYKCGECPLSFGSESALARHIREHRGEYPHKCDVCTKGFRTRKQMLAHKRRTHRTPSILYQCQFCPRKLKDKDALKAHENCHKGIRPYVCFTCSKAFRDSYSLKCHTLTHTGEKPHECTVCQRRFRVPHQLFQHMISHEKEKRQEASKGINMPSISGETSLQIEPSTSVIMDE